MPKKKNYKAPEISQEELENFREHCKIINEKTKAISANATLELLTAPLVLQTGEILKATAATGNRLHIVASILEVS